MSTLHIDIETYSSVNLKTSGLYKYVQSGDFEIMLLAYAFDDGPVEIIDYTQGETTPMDVRAAITGAEAIKVAHNAAFEYNALSKWLGTTPLSTWRCSMVHALYCGYPAALAQTGEAMGLPEDKKKMAIGKALIKYFCVPCQPTKANGGRIRNHSRHDMQKWELFKEYCRQDVVTEREISKRLAAYPVPESEWRLYQIDHLINRTGVRVDEELITGALAISEQTETESIKVLQDLTGLENPNSVAQLKEWLNQSTGKEVSSLNKEALSELMDQDLPEDVKRVLNIRKELGKTSVKKYGAMKSCVCKDGRVRGLLQFYGANRTGRWAGRLVQIQNLPKNFLGTLSLARDYTKKKNKEALRLLYGNVPDTLSQLIRTAFIPRVGYHFAIADFSAIEARVVAWLAGESWRLDVFRTHGKIYEASASAMFGVPLESIAKGKENYGLRAKGKIAELALGYGGGVGALLSMGALKMGLSEDELPEIIKRWRGSNTRIVAFWYMVENAAKECVRYGTATTLKYGVTFSRDSKFLKITLPSGRTLFYSSPAMDKNERGQDEIYYLGQNQTNKKWSKISTWGGKLVENIVQAVSRDLLAHALIRLYEAGYCINFHVHDEVVLEIKNGSTSQSLEEAIRLMCDVPEWAVGLPLNADGFATDYYKKD